MAQNVLDEQIRFMTENPLFTPNQLARLAAEGWRLAPEEIGPNDEEFPDGWAIYRADDSQLDFLAPDQGQAVIDCRLADPAAWSAALWLRSGAEDAGIHYAIARDA